MLAIPWYFAQQGKSDTFIFWLGVFTLTAFGWSLYAGSLIDRFPRKRVFMVTNLTEGAILACVALIGFAQGGLPNALVLAVFGMTLLGYNIHFPNLYAFGQEITPPDQYVKINSQLEVIGQTTRGLSGALAAILLEGVDWSGQWHLLGATIPYDVHLKAWPLHQIFLTDGITYFIATVIIAFIQYTPYARRKVEMGALVERLKGGFRFLNRHRLIALFGFFSHSIFAIAIVRIHGVSAPYVSNWLVEDGSIIGAQQLLYSCGAVVAGFLVKRLFSDLTTPGVLIGLMFAAATAAFFSASTQAVYIYLAVGFTFGFTNASSRILRVSYLFRHVPNGVIGRVTSIFTVANTLTRSAFIFLFSTAIFQGPNIHYAYWYMGGFILLSGLAMLAYYRRLIAMPIPEEMEIDGERVAS